MKSIGIQFIYDFSGPWCGIGHSHLRTAQAPQPSDIAPAVQYRPYQLNPDRLKKGANRKTYRSAKLGNRARFQEVDADVTLGGKCADQDFSYGCVAVTPNTRLVHRLMCFAAGRGEAQKTEAFYEAAFHAYFSEGKSIGDAEVLVALASQTGFNPEEVRSCPFSPTGERELIEVELRARVNDVRSVPTVRIGEALISRAQAPAMFVQALQEATALLNA
ncbi:DsbA family oxidoreductase [Bordetella avium]|uniref:DsbA family oxidoreductase n=1 Tax=Bordetella avium TaxID=521 RepID=UPI000FDA2186|nr:DsbA family oxidoreductase [Bordetella avium]AZY48947.1 DsbA family oxidoreductase [Bordetella avium]